MFRTICNTMVLPAAALTAALCMSASAQEPNPTSVAPGARQANIVAEGPNGIYIYRVKVVQHDLDAVNYLNRSGATNVGFAGTNLAPQAKGEAKVDSKTGKTNISVRVEGLTPANGFGEEYLTYVLWAISADGKPQNLGELELSGNKANLDVTSPFQSFGMIVTAEPYYSVSAPSDVIVLQNVFRKDTQGILQTVNVHYSLLPRGLYANTPGAKTVMHPITDREHTPLALFEAYNAQRIALNTGADKYAADIMAEVATDLKNAQDIQDSKHRDVKMEFTYARQATQRAEDARITTLRKQQTEREQQQQDAKVAAQEQARQSELAAAQSQAQTAQAQAAQAQAQAEADRAAAARAQAEAQKAQADAAAAAAQAQAADAQRQADAAKNSEAALRAKLLTQLNAVLQTTETARGLMVNLSDVLFDTGKYTLKQNTQISLAQVATILNLYQGLKVQVEGYTDNTGSDALNQKLSEDRARAVSNFLTGHGVPPANLTSAGYGKSDAVADNSTAAGRAQNRRVELIISGEAIGVQTSAGPSNGQ